MCLGSRGAREEVSEVGSGAVVWDPSHQGRKIRAGCHCWPQTAEMKRVCAYARKTACSGDLKGGALSRCYVGALHHSQCSPRWNACTQRTALSLRMRAEQNRRKRQSVLACQHLIASPCWHGGGRTGWSCRKMHCRQARKGYKSPGRQAWRRWRCVRRP